MSSRAPRALLTLILALVTAWAVPAAVTAAAEDDHGSQPGFVFVQIDGLSEPLMRMALESGAMPYLSELIDQGSHTLGGWRTTAASTTTVTQAGLLHGNQQEVPGFRWWDRETGQLLDFLDREQARLFEARIDGPADLLADGGASITNLFTGGAPRVVFTATNLDGLTIVWEVVRYLADLPKVAHTVAGFADGVVAELRHVLDGEAAPLTDGIKRKAPVPVVGPALEWALVEVGAAAVVRELQRGTPNIYTTMTTYDEIGHYAGVDHPVAMAALTHIDESLAFISSVAEGAPRPYHLVVLSDHGQTDGQPFALRYGETLTDVVNRHLAPGADPAGADNPPDLVVAASGNLAHIYLPAQGERIRSAEIESRHPGLVEGLVAHPGIGLVAVQQEDGGLLAFGPAGSHDLTSGLIEGQDPLAHYGLYAAESLHAIAASPNAGDLVVISMYDPVADEVASFEPQLGSHGGIGGAQMEPFLLYPSEFESDAEPLALVGIAELRAKVDEWLAQAQAAPAPMAHLGPEVCTSAAVRGGEGEVCARRDRFGADWTLRLVDTEDDDRRVRARISLAVGDAQDEGAALENDRGAGTTVSSTGSFAPLVGSSIGIFSITTCVVIRFFPDRCQTSSAALPQLRSRATPAQSARLEQLVFEEPLDRFMAIWEQPERDAIDAGFDWTTNGCSAGPFAELFDDLLRDACIRHDFAYRNYGNLFYTPTDAMRLRVDEQLAADAIALGQGALAPGLRDTLKRFGAPAFFGSDLAAEWSVPGFLAGWLSGEETDAPAD